MNPNKKSALGRGLDALIMMDEIKAGGSSSISEIEISKIVPNPEQPRTEFDQTALDELAASIAAIGIIQPITLRETGNGSYQIIAGERRFRASKIAGKTSIPAYIRTAKDENVMEMALIENIQREDLNAIEIALSYQKLIEQYGLTQEKLSERVGKNRTTIANFLRLLKLPAEIQIGLKNKQIDNGHARALLSLDDAQLQLALYEETVQQGHSVRKVEERVKSVLAGETQETAKAEKQTTTRSSEEYVLLKDHLSKFFTQKAQYSCKVQLSCSDNGKGKISIPFKSDEELQRILDIFDKLQ
ncbi:MAG: ParB/RepB/Spo0J family partition protein [Bacteroidales bacterium]